MWEKSRCQQAPAYVGSLAYSPRYGEGDVISPVIGRATYVALVLSHQVDA